MNKKVNFVWELKEHGWRWEASHYQGNGIFYGKVTSPFVPSGEFGTWYIWEIEQNGAILVSGNKEELDEIKKKSQKVQIIQKALMGD